MGRRSQTKAARSDPAAFVKRHYARANHSPRRRSLQRSPLNWFLDAATYAHDGDHCRARRAAHTGLKALHRQGGAW